MLPFIKIASLILKVFSRPVINMTKARHKNRKNNSSELFTNFFIRLGIWQHQKEMQINRKILNLPSSDMFFVKPISDDLSLEKGIEFFYEIIFYAIIIGVPLYEMYVQSVESTEKSIKLNQRLAKIEENISNQQGKTSELELNIKKEYSDIKTLLKNYDHSFNEFSSFCKTKIYDIQTTQFKKMEEKEEFPNLNLNSADERATIN